MGEALSRSEAVALIESFLDCIVRGELDRLPAAPDLTVQSPLTPKRDGAAAMEYVKLVSASVTGIRVRQHIVEGEHVASLLDQETVNGPLEVFSKFRIASGRIQDVRVFYDPRQVAGST